VHVFALYKAGTLDLVQLMSTVIFFVTCMRKSVRFQNFRREGNEIDLSTSPFIFDIKEVPGNLQVFKAN
jgi:hypothetical protein